jgi:hypothetical protein
MSESKFTPGPWSRDKFGNVVDAAGERVGFRGVTIVCSGAPERVAEAEANTDLSVAAPDLLAAVRLMLEAYDDGVQPDWAQPAIKASHAAITKATASPMGKE